MLHRLFLAAGLLLIALPAVADDSDAYMCRNGLFASDKQTVTLARATGKPRTFFLWDKDTKGCPSDVKPCHAGYVLPGQEVLMGKRANGFVCAFYPNDSGGGAGWVPEDRLAAEPVQPTSDPALAAWVGHWKNGNDVIDIITSGGMLTASGSAIWKGFAIRTKGRSKRMPSRTRRVSILSKRVATSRRHCSAAICWWPTIPSAAA